MATQMIYETPLEWEMVGVPGTPLPVWPPFLLHRDRGAQGASVGGTAGGPQSPLVSELISVDRQST